MQTKPTTSPENRKYEFTDETATAWDGTALDRNRAEVAEKITEHMAERAACAAEYRAELRREERMGV